MVRQKTPKARESFTRDPRPEKSDACGPQTRCRASKESTHERGRKRERRKQGETLTVDNALERVLPKRPGANAAAR